MLVNGWVLYPPKDATAINWQRGNRDGEQLTSDELAKIVQAFDGYNKGWIVHEY